MSGNAYVGRSLALVAWVGGAMLLAAPAGADTYFVDREDDALVQTCSPLPGDCTLRGAIRKANQRAGSDTIVFTASVDTVLLTISGVGEDAALTGDLDLTDPVLIDGDGRVSIRADGLGDRVFDVVSPDDVTLSGLTIGGGISGVRAKAAPSGEFLALVDCLVTDNGNVLPQVRGGGIEALRRLILDGTIISDNAAQLSGGGVYIQDPGCGESIIANSSIEGNATDSAGSAIWFGCGTLTISKSTVWGNSSSNSTIYAGTTPSSLVIQSSTVSDNIARPPAAFYATVNGKGATGQLTLEFSTMVVSEGLAFGRPGIAVFGVESTGSVIVGSCVGSMISHGGNLESPGDTCEFDPLTDQLSVADPGLRPLAYYGGPTRTRLPKPGSPLVDDPLDAMPSCPSQDQRVLPRPADGDGDGAARCDTGAVERQEAEFIFTDGFEG